LPPENKIARRSKSSLPLLWWVGLVVAIAMGCSNGSSAPTRAWASVSDADAEGTVPPGYQLDSFAELYLGVGPIKVGRLKDDSLVGQFEVTNKTNQPITFKYKWLWMNADGISIEHGQKRWKVIDLGSSESRLIQSRPVDSSNLSPLVRISSFSNSQSR